MNPFTHLLTADLALGTIDKSPQLKALRALPPQRREHGKLIHAGTYRRTFGEGHSCVERQMKRDARKQRRLKVMVRN